MMKQKRAVLSVMALSVFLGGCSLNMPVGEENQTQEQQHSVTQAIDASDSYYQMLLPFKPAEARGVVQRQLNSTLELEEIELGLMRHSTKVFDPSDHVYQEGQLLTRNDIVRLISRQGKGADANQEISTFTPLNPSFSNGMTMVADDKYIAESKKTPMYLETILEQDYLVEKGNNYERKGVSLALVLNREYSFQWPEFGPTYTVKLEEDKIVAEGERMAANLLTQLRTKKEFKDLEINLALYVKAPEGSPTPGNYVSVADVGKGNTLTSGDWKSVDEKHYYFPSSTANTEVREDAQKFTLFSDRIADVFPDFSGMIGKGFYQGGTLRRLEIDVPVQVYSRAELIGFTQHLVGLMENRWEYSRNVEVRVNVTSIGGKPEVTIVYDKEMEKPSVYF